MKVGTIVRMKLTDRLGLVENRFWFFGWRCKVLFPEELFEVEKEYEYGGLFTAFMNPYGPGTKVKHKEKFKRLKVNMWVRAECLERSYSSKEADEFDRLLGGPK